MSRNRGVGTDGEPVVETAPAPKWSGTRRGLKRYISGAAAVCAVQVVFTLVLLPTQNSTVDLGLYYEVISLPLSILLGAAIPIVFATTSYWLHWVILWSERLALREPTPRFLVPLAIAQFCQASL